MPSRPELTPKHPNHFRAISMTALSLVGIILGIYILKLYGKYIFYVMGGLLMGIVFSSIPVPIWVSGEKLTVVYDVCNELVMSPYEKLLCSMMSWTAICTSFLLYGSLLAFLLYHIYQHFK